MTESNRETGNTGTGSGTGSKRYQTKSQYDSGGTRDWIIGTRLLNEYIVKDVLGRGGMGTVYLVERALSHGVVQFAVKTLFTETLADEEKRQLFFEELKTWIELPEHPHITACRFFRTVDKRLGIFAEAIHGGALQTWISSGRVTEPAQILDIAIQVAWGLAAAHSHRVIHQDVKPHNILMTPDGTAKVTDFGLAKARQSSGLTSSTITQTGNTMMVSSHGLTVAYCSPEQAAGLKLTRRTDIFSFGVVLLEMFLGRVRWRVGPLAPMVLDNHLHTGTPPHIPEPVIPVLRQCLQEDPALRYSGMPEVAQALILAYEAVTHSSYPRSEPEYASREDMARAAEDRFTGSGSEWVSPEKTLRNVLVLAGRDPAEAARLLPPRKGSRKSQALADLAGLETAQKIMESGPEYITRDPALYLTIIDNISMIQKHLGDLPGASATSDFIIDFVDRFLDDSMAPEQAETVMAKKGWAITRNANIRFVKGRYTDAAALYLQAIEIWEQLAPMLETRDARIALVCQNLGSALFMQNQFADAVQFYRRAVEIWKENARKYSIHEYLHSLATVSMNMGLCFWKLEDLDAAMATLNRAIIYLERAVYEFGDQHLRIPLATLFCNTATVHIDRGEFGPARTFFQRSIDLFHQLITVEGRSECAMELARTCMNMVPVELHEGSLAAADALYDRSIEILERLIDHEGMTYLSEHLATIFVGKAEVLRRLERYDASRALTTRARAMLEPMIVMGNRTDLQFQLSVIRVAETLTDCMQNGPRQLPALFFSDLSAVRQISGEMGNMVYRCFVEEVEHFLKTSRIDVPGSATDHVME